MLVPGCQMMLEKILHSVLFHSCPPLIFFPTSYFVPSALSLFLSLQYTGVYELGRGSVLACLQKNLSLKMKVYFSNTFLLYSIHFPPLSFQPEPFEIQNRVKTNQSVVLALRCLPCLQPLSHPGSLSEALRARGIRWCCGSNCYLLMNTLLSFHLSHSWSMCPETGSEVKHLFGKLSKLPQAGASSSCLSFCHSLCSSLLS